MKTLEAFVTAALERNRFATNRNLSLNANNPHPVRHMHPHECEGLDWDGAVKIAVRFTELGIIPATVRIRWQDENGYFIPAPV